MYARACPGGCLPQGSLLPTRLWSFSRKATGTSSLHPTLHPVDVVQFQMPNRMLKIGALVGLLSFALLAHAAEIKGRVVNAAGGEALGRVQVTVLETGAATNTAGDGTFTLTGLAPGRYT